MVTENEQAIAEVERLEAETARLKAAIGDALLALGTGECKINQCEGCKEDEHAAVQGLKAALAEDDDGELKPEAEARLRESLEKPHEELLTSDEMRQKLEDDDAGPG